MRHENRRARAAFADAALRELPEARHVFVEDAPGDVARAIATRSGG